MPPPARPQEPIHADVDIYDKPTALVSHCAFFDPDGDGIVWPLDTYRGFRALGFSIFFSGYGMVMIHLALSWGVGVTHLGGWVMDPFWRLDVRKMHKGMHGGDTDSYTKKGEFDQRRFDDIFETYTAPPHDSMSFREMLSVMKGQNDALDPVGCLNSAHEWISTYAMLWPKDGRMKKSEVYGCYTGDIFYQIAAARSRREAKQGHPIWGFGQEGLLPPRPTSPDTAAANSGCPFAGMVKKKEGHEEDGKEEDGNGNGNGYQDEKTSLLGREEAEERKKEKAYTRQQID